MMTGKKKPGPGSEFGFGPLKSEKKPRRRRGSGLPTASPLGHRLAQEALDGLAVSMRGWGNPANMEVYDPGDRQLVPEAGAIRAADMAASRQAQERKG